MGKQKLGLAAAVALAASFAASAPALAAPTPAAAPADGGASTVVSQIAQQPAGSGYWTAERMRNALPGDRLADKALERGTRTAVEHVAQGLAERVEGQRAEVRKGKPAPKAEESPVSHIGKVFFTLGGQNYVCSGNSVASSNRSTVSTAGHCLNEGPGAFATNFVFVPAYDDGAAPYGKWSAESLHAPSRWVNNGDMAYDTGFAVVAPLNGTNLADAVGASGVQFNAVRGLGYKAFGYPAARPYDGSDLISCTDSQAENDPYNPQFNSQGIDCDMTGGSSGGPWFVGTTSGGYQNSVNSYGYGSNSTTMYGPYWGSVIQTTYQSASGS
jgi:V8-like Glu-specific endopeptidase